MCNPRQFPPARPPAATQLVGAEALLLLAIRWWVVSWRDGSDPLPRLCRGFARAGAPEAAWSLDSLMAAIARLSRRSLAIHAPRCPALSDDETCLLRAAGHMQGGDPDKAEALLRATLLVTRGTSFALGPLSGLATLFAAAELRFRPYWPAHGAPAVLH